MHEKTTKKLKLFFLVKSKPGKWSATAKERRRIENENENNLIKPGKYLRYKDDTIDVLCKCFHDEVRIILQSGVLKEQKVD